MKRLMLLWFISIKKRIEVKFRKNFDIIFFHIFNVLVLILLVYFPGLYTAPENMEHDMKNLLSNVLQHNDLENYCLF
jgi:hypothetical protein